MLRESEYAKKLCNHCGIVGVWMIHFIPVRNKAAIELSMSACVSVRACVGGLLCMYVCVCVC